MFVVWEGAVEEKLGPCVCGAVVAVVAVEVKVVVAVVAALVVTVIDVVVSITVVLSGANAGTSRTHVGSVETAIVGTVAVVVIVSLCVSGPTVSVLLLLHQVLQGVLVSVVKRGVL